MTYDLKKAMGTAAKVGIAGLGVIVFGEAESAEAVQNLGYLTLGASVVGAGAAGLAGLIDRERPYKKKTSKNLENSVSKKSQKEPSSRQKYLDQRAAQRYNQKLALDERIRRNRYEVEAQRAGKRMEKEGLSGALWRTFYRIKY